MSVCFLFGYIVVHVVTLVENLRYKSVTSSSGQDKPGNDPHHAAESPRQSRKRTPQILPSSQR